MFPIARATCPDCQTPFRVDLDEASKIAYFDYNAECGKCLFLANLSKSTVRLRGVTIQEGTPLHD